MPADAARVYATAGGTLTKMLPAGSKVHRGDVIGQLQDTGAEIELAKLEGERKLRQLHVDHLERLRGLDHEANDQLPAARSALADSQRRLDERRQEARRLTVTAPVDGVIIPAPRKQLSRQAEVQLPTWTGSLLEPKTLGAHVDPGTLICLIGDPSKLTAVLLVDDADIKRLAPGQKTRLRIDELPRQVIEGEVTEVARHELGDLEDLKARQADLSPLLVGLVPPGRTGAHYEALVKFGEERERSDSESSLLAPRSSSLVIGGRGDAKVTAERITIGRLIYRYFAQTFQLPM
jgi:putative peptide zinc metalloprotease protein